MANPSPESAETAFSAGPAGRTVAVARCTRESLAAIELNSAIELLNNRPGATASEAAIEQTRLSYVSV